MVGRHFRNLDSLCSFCRFFELTFVILDQFLVLLLKDFLPLTLLDALQRLVAIPLLLQFDERLDSGFPAELSK